MILKTAINIVQNQAPQRQRSTFKVLSKVTLLPLGGANRGDYLTFF